MSAPICSSSSRSPVRVGLTPTLRSIRPFSAARHPATRKNAADEKSAGTAICAARSTCPPSSAMVEPLRSTSTPKAASMRSV